MINGFGATFGQNSSPRPLCGGDNTSLVVAVLLESLLGHEELLGILLHLHILLVEQSHLSHGCICVVYSLLTGISSRVRPLRINLGKIWHTLRYLSCHDIEPCLLKVGAHTGCVLSSVLTTGPLIIRFQTDDQRLLLGRCIRRLTAGVDQG